MGLGPDGPAGSNNDFNMFEEMDLAAKLQKVTTMDPQALPASAAFEMATIRGARALGMEKEIGSLEAGKRADLITVRLDPAHAQPLYDAVSQMVYALKGVRRPRRDGERQARGARREDPDAERSADAGEGGGVSRQGQRLPEVARSSDLSPDRERGVPASRRPFCGRMRSCSRH